MPLTGKDRSMCPPGFPAAPLIVLGSAIALFCVCGCGECKAESWQGAAGPVVRVLLTGKPIRTAEISTSGAYSLFVDDQCVATARRRLGGREVSRSGDSWLVGSLAAEGGVFRVSVSGDALVRLGQTDYRGELRFHPAGDNSFVVVNHVDVESYLIGVLSKELYPGWSPTTYCAQAVAARTYALYKQSFLADRTYDLVSGQADQVYGGASAETPKSRRAAMATQGWVLAYGADGDERIFLSQYSACNGGTVNPAYVIRNAPRIEPLMGGQADPHGRRCPRYTWPAVKVSKAAIWRAVASSYPAAEKLGGLSRIETIESTPYGRCVWLDLVGTSGKKLRLRADDLRLCLLRSGPRAAGGLYSMNCRIRDLGKAVEFYDGRGYGHGVGLSQWGAEEKARLGWSVLRVLQFYYPGAKIFRAY